MDRDALNSIRNLLQREGVNASSDALRSLQKKTNRNKILLFGPGNNGRQLARQLATTPLASSVLGFVSDIPQHLGMQVEGHPVWSRDQAFAKFGSQVVLVNCVYRADTTISEVTAGLRSSGFEFVISLPFFYGAFSEFLPAFYCFSSAEELIRRQDEIMSAFCLLSDRSSQRTFFSLLEQRVSLDFSASREFDPAIYFPTFLSRTDFSPARDPFVFVDCGAYNGDTVAKFVNWNQHHNAHVIAFEPDVATFEELQRVSSQIPLPDNIKVSCVHSAVGKYEGQIGFMGLNSESSYASETATATVPITTVDRVLADLHCVASYVKYDTEGFEREAIWGTQNAIASGCALAVSVYHKPEDLWAIPLLLRDLQNKYKFHLREHGPDGIDTVLYAIPVAKA